VNPKKIRWLFMIGFIYQVIEIIELSYHVF